MKNQMINGEHVGWGLLSADLSGVAHLSVVANAKMEAKSEASAKADYPTNSSRTILLAAIIVLLVVTAQRQNTAAVWASRMTHT
jgi:hypothetical protein